MYTDCPGCHRQFHVYAAQLSAAGGMVKCGFCGEKFNALERLRDKPLTRPPQEPAVSGESKPPVEPDFIIPEPDGKQGETEQAGIEAAESRAVSAAADKPGLKPAGQTVTGRKPAASVSGPRRDSFKYSEALLEQPVQSSGWVSRLLWGFGILLLIVFASTQVVWFNRDAIMNRYPDTIPWFDRLCQKFGCEIIRHRDPGSIELLNRDVRDHPRYKNALLVNATMINRSQTVQAYPVVQLNLFDVDGKLIAYRQFQPEDYLDDSINILQGMAPDVPVHFVLEVLDSAKGAVSFEFEFH